MKVCGTQKVEVEISERELGYALMRFGIKKYIGDEDFDDGGCDWVTKDGVVYIDAMEAWKVSENEEFASLVDTVNILIYGKRLTYKG